MAKYKSVQIKSNKDHPEVTSSETKPKIDDDIKEYIVEVNAKIDAIKDARSEWENRLNRWYKQRYGRRKAKSFPWPNASNIHLPTIDRAIKKMMPYYVMLLWAPKQIAQFEIMRGDSANEVIFENQDQQITLKDAATYNEHMLDYTVKDQMYKSFLKSIQWTSKMMMWGRTVVKVTYEYRTRTKEIHIDLDELEEGGKLYIANNPQLVHEEGASELAELFQALLRDQKTILDLEDGDQVRQLKKNMEAFREGKTKFTFLIKIQEAHSPHWYVCNPQDIIIPININDLQDAPIICHETYWSEVKLQEEALNGRFDADVVQKIIDNRNTQGRTELKTGSYTDGKSTLESTIDVHTGALGNHDVNDMIKVREVCCLTKDKKSGIYCKKSVLTYCVDYLEEPLSFRDLVYNDGKWPYVDFVFESDQDYGWHSPRGVPEMLDYLATTLNVMHNQKIDRMTIGNAPMWEYVAGSVNPQNVRYIPGQWIPVTNAKSINPLILPNRQDSYIEEERHLTALVENYLSSPDFGLTNATGPALSARTATEIQNVSQQKNDVFEMAARLYLQNFSELLEMTWARHMQFGKDRYKLYLPDDQNPIEWVRQYGLRNMSIRPRGTLQNSSPSIRLAESREMMQIAANPQFAPYHKLEAVLREYYTAKDPDRVDEFLHDIQTVTQKQEEAIGLQMQEQEKAMQFQMEMKRLDHQFEIDKIRAEGRERIALEIAKMQGQKKNESNQKKKNKTQSKA